MTAFTLICACGQSMSVPESAIGRNGLCPGCGAEIAITRERLRDTALAQQANRRGGGLLSQRHALQVAQNNEHREEAWRKFAVAVDLYNNKRYAEALTLLNTLEQTFPGNPNIGAAQEQCAEALKEAASPTLQYEGAPLDDSTLTPELVKSIILKKMLHGGTEDIQLKAAELAARVVGLLDPTPTPQPAPTPVITPAPDPFAAPQQSAPATNGNNGTHGETKPARRTRSGDTARRHVEEIP